MSKFIYEYNKNHQGYPFKNKYTVVYENKTYYYCKVNGNDRLTEINKESINNNSGRYFLSNMDVSEDIKEAETNNFPFGVEKDYCFWCDMKLHKSLFDDIYALNAVYPEYCPWCGKKIYYKFK